MKMLMVSIPATFGELAERVYEMLHKVLRIGFVTDSYRSLAIKEIETLSKRCINCSFGQLAIDVRSREWKIFFII